jgi:hypothetical protein
MFDMNKCSKGDKLLSTHGTVLEYVGIDGRQSPYRHVVKYPNGALGSRTDSGEVFIKNKMEIDEDIIGFAKI